MANSKFSHQDEIVAAGTSNGKINIINCAKAKVI